MRLNATALAVLAAAAVLTPLLSAPHQRPRQLPHPLTSPLTGLLMGPLTGLLEDLRARALSRRLRPGWRWLTEQCPDIVLDPPMRGGVTRLARRIAECYEAADRLATLTPPNTHHLLDDALRAGGQNPPPPTTLAALLLEVASQLHRGKDALLPSTGARAHLARLCEQGRDASLHERALSLQAVFTERARLRSHAVQLLPVVRSELRESAASAEPAPQRAPDLDATR